MSLQQELQKIKQGTIAPVYLVLGTEFALQEQVKKTFSAQFAADDEELNQVSIDLTETPLSDAIFEANSIPFFGDRRLIIAENPLFLTGAKNQSSIEHNTDELIDYLKAPLESSTLVFFAPYEKLDERKKVVKALKKAAIILDVAPLNEQAIRKIAQDTFTQNQISISKEAFELLLVLTDNDFSRLQGELTKLTLYAQTQKTITLDDINRLVPRTPQQNIFDLGNYLLAGNAEKALQLYADLLLAGEEPIKINAILLSQFRLYLQVKIMLGDHLGKAQMASKLAINPYRIQLAMVAVGKLSYNYLSQFVIDLVEQDFELKQSTMEKNLLFQFFILKHAKNPAS